MAILIANFFKGQKFLAAYSYYYINLLTHLFKFTCYSFSNVINLRLKCIACLLQSHRRQRYRTAQKSRDISSSEDLSSVDDNWTKRKASWRKGHGKNTKTATLLACLKSRDTLF